ncbi:MAG: malate dehydrogenase [Dehalococcoidia bacterium]|nr:malate dehydrogenase [Dehalococcoidia bacterium]
MTRKKVSIIGAGNVGATVAQNVFAKGYADIVLVDIVEGLPQGKALDMLESGPIVGSDAQVIGTNGYDETKDSDIVVITSGVARKPGMSRDDLLYTNMKIVGDVTRKVVAASPNAIIIPVTNPLDAMAQYVLETSKFPRERVIAMAGELDTARFRTFIAQELKVSVDDVHAYVLGSHGDQMVPLVNASNVAGVPLTHLFSREKLAALVKRTQEGGGEIVSLLKTGSAYYAPGAAVAQMVAAIILDKHAILPCCVLLKGEYSIRDLFIGVPCKLGAKGLEQIIELTLTPEEFQMLRKSAEAVRDLVAVLHKAPVA